MRRAVLAVAAAVTFGILIAVVAAYDRSAFMALLLIHIVVVPPLASSILPRRHIEAFRQAFTTSLVVWMAVLLATML